MISQDAVLTDASVIHHGLSFVNKKISENHFYDSGRSKLSKPGPLPPETRARKAKEKFEYWLEKGDEFLRHYGYALKDNSYNIIDARFKEVFPQRNEEEKRLFQLLKKAYVDARYKKDYRIGEEELTYLGERVQLLAQLTQELCQQEIARLKG